MIDARVTFEQVSVPIFVALNPPSNSNERLGGAYAEVPTSWLRDRSNCHHPFQRTAVGNRAPRLAGIPEWANATIMPVGHSAHKVVLDVAVNAQPATLMSFEAREFVE